MELSCEILLYFNNRSFLMDMKNTSQKFKDQLNEKNILKFPPLRHVLELNVMDLLDTCPEAGQSLLKEPMKWQNICNEILYATYLSIDSESPPNIKLAQVFVNLRLNSIPSPLIPQNSHYYNGLVSLQGLLMAISKSETYAYHTVWCCPEECEGNEVILHFIPKTPPKCYVCKSVLFENSGLRRCGEQVTVTINVNNLQHKNIKIVDDMIPKLKVGSDYKFYATVLKKVVNVWSLEEIFPIPIPITSPIPEDIEEVFHACKGVSWKFIYCLASSIGINVSPLNCFMHLKIYLLLSLTSVKANLLNDSPIVHVFAAGYDTGFIGELMTEAAKLARRFVSMGASNSTVSATLLGASSGVCMLPLTLNAYNQKQIFSILSSVESGEISTETDTIKLKCAVWCHGMDYKKITLFNVANVFGSICRGDYGEFNDVISEFLLERATTPVEICDEEKKVLNDIKLYTELVADIQVSLDSHAEVLLRNYFLSARKDRPRGVSVGSMNTLVAICITSARLCRRPIANVDDALLAIWLHVSGAPEPRLAPEEYLQTPADVNSLQKILKQFKIWLAEFTGVSID